MNTEHDLLRALIEHLRAFPDLPRTLQTDDDAVRIFLDAAFAGRCPRCRGAVTAVVDHRHVACRHCPEPVSVTAPTALARTRISLRHWLLAAWHLGVSSESIPARGFARRYALRVQTSWRLLHRIREAFVHPYPESGVVCGQVTGFVRPANRASLAFGLTEGRLAICRVEDAPPVTGPPFLSYALGHMRAWLAALFRGVRRKYLLRYAAEWGDRFRRVAWHFGSTTT